MINGISNTSNVAFKATAADKVTPELINKAGNFEDKQDSLELSSKKAKKGGVLKAFVGMLVAAGAVVGGLVLAAKKGWTKALPTEAVDPKLGAKISDALNKAGTGIEKFFVDNWNKLFKKKEDVAEAVTEAATEVKPAAVGDAAENIAT